MWKRLKHPNVLLLLGVTITPPQLVTNLMHSGDLPKHINDHPNPDRLGLVGFPPVAYSHAHSHNQLFGVAKGLCYLHSGNVIHGDLKGVRRSKFRFTVALTPDQKNVLVDDSGQARIADFGFATVARSLDSIRSASNQRGHSVRWAAPEILKGGKHSKEADIFSLAMVMIEVGHGWSIVCGALVYCHFTPTQVFTGGVPFNGTGSMPVMLAIIGGDRPPRPMDPQFTEDLWTLMQGCWDRDPDSRPAISKIVTEILTVSVRNRLIGGALATHERASLIEAILLDNDQIKAVENLSEDDAQILIDVINEVNPCATQYSKDRLIDFNSNLRVHQLGAG